MKILYIISWLFTCFITVVDINFIFMNKNNVAEWECNPSILWIVENFGYKTAMGLRACTFIYALFVSTLNKRAAYYTTISVLLVHLWLAHIYFQIYLIQE